MLWWTRNILGQLAAAMPQAVTVTPEEREAIQRVHLFIIQLFGVLYKIFFYFTSSNIAFIIMSILFFCSNLS